MSSNLIPPSTTIWGPHGWKFLHYVSLGYPEHPTEEDKINYKNFFISIKNILPCIICSNHYAENYDKIPLTDAILSDKTSLVRWVIDIHNVVNKSKNKRIVPYDEALALINTDTVCNNDNSNCLYTWLFILCGLIIIALIYRKK